MAPDNIPNRDGARVMSVSVDLDALDCYWRIHALPGAPPERSRFTILRRCLPRFAALFDRHDVRATFFVVGRDLEDDSDGRALLGELARAGHELANHTHTHPYDFVTLGRARIDEEIDRAHAAIADCAGHAPRGFRAPGYEISADVLEALCARRYRYDSSAFPSLPYYGAKAAIMGVMRVLGRPSGSHLGSARVLAAPRLPYRPAWGAPYRRGMLDIVELPVTVTPVSRLPVFGTSLVATPGFLMRHLLATALRQPFFNLELHGIDLADADGDEIPPALVARQPDLRRPLAYKMAALEATLLAAREAGAQRLRLDEAATTYST
jgi:peptidoglycan-N-acetylglucosamine deacetylase